MQVSQSIHELVLLEAQSKAIEAKMGVHKAIVKKHAEDRYLADYASLGVPPESPNVVQNADGEQVTLVCQDRSGQYAVKEDQQEALADLLGEEATDGLLFTEMTFKFSREVMCLPGVQPAVEKALEKAVTDMLKRDVVTRDQADGLVVADVKTAFKPGTFNRLVQICGADVQRMKKFIAAAGSSFVRYTKV